MKKDKNNTIIENLPNEISDDKNESNAHEVMVHQSLSYGGPLPPAAEFQRYEEVSKGAGEKILLYAEK